MGKIVGPRAKGNKGEGDLAHLTLVFRQRQ